MLRDGHEVHLLLRPGYRAWRLGEILSSVYVAEADLCDAEAVRRAVRRIRPDRVFHLAAYGAYSTQQGLERMTATNFLGCAALLDACAETGVEAFVNAGSSSEYGCKDHAPREDEVLEPNSHYAITKAAATHYCRHTALSRDVNAVTARLYSVYGPREEPTRLIPTLIVKGLRGELPPLVSPGVARDFIYVDDAVDAIAAIAEAAPPRGSVYNICGGRQTTIREIVSVARRLLDVREEPVWASMPDRAWDTAVWVGTGEKLERELGWRAETPLEAGLEKTIDWLRADPERLRFYSEMAEQKPAG